MNPQHNLSSPKFDPEIGRALNFQRKLSHCFYTMRYIVSILCRCTLPTPSCGKCHAALSMFPDHKHTSFFFGFTEILVSITGASCKSGIPVLITEGCGASHTSRLAHAPGGGGTSAGPHPPHEGAPGHRL